MGIFVSQSYTIGRPCYSKGFPEFWLGLTIFVPIAGTVGQPRDRHSHQRCLRLGLTGECIKVEHLDNNQEYPKPLERSSSLSLNLKFLTFHGHVNHAF
jgi:hypothetical protein